MPWRTAVFAGQHPCEHLPVTQQEPQYLGKLHLLTVDEYLALGETEPGYTELQEGRLLLAPSPLPAHNVALHRLTAQLDDQVPPGYEVLPDIDIDLELAPPDEPGFSRRPDVIIARCVGVERAEQNGGIIRADEVVLMVEIVSPTSVRMDTKVKHGEYADAGIPHYWILDVDEPPSLVACRLGEGGYENARPAQHRFTTESPFAIDVDLDNLVM